MPAKLSQEEYLKRCVEKHGNKYGLQHIEYARTSSKVKVECYEHGIFHVHAGTFMRGTGCAKCAYEYNGLKHRVTQEDFITRSREIHGEAYDYKTVVYTKSDVKVKIWCNACANEFEMTPEAHLVGQGCRTCGYKRNGLAKRADFAKFVEESRFHHGDKFSYEHVEGVWTGIHTKFDLYCHVHQECFVAYASTHAKGAGCPKCAKIAGGIKNRSDTETFIQQGKKKFGDAFDYTKADYVKNNKKVTLRCTEHDKWFNVTPNVHLHPDNTHGGCPQCVQAGYKIAKPGYLYVLHVDELTKVGITNRQPEVRCKSVARESSKSFEVLKAYYFNNGMLPREIETTLLRELRAQYKQPLERFDGSKETFYNVNLASLLNRIEELIATQTAALAA
jgi:Zn finger protein HypA/HybF involved in hydrogenase expression